MVALIQQQGMSISASQIPEAIIIHFKREPADDSEAIKRDLIAACFLDRTIGELLYFPHRSFQKYLVAENFLIAVLLKGAVRPEEKGPDIKFVFQASDVVQEMLTCTKQYAIYNLASLVEDSPIEFTLQEIVPLFNREQREIVEMFFFKVNSLQLAAKNLEALRSGRPRY